jgi:hypothetical protein
MISKPAGAPFLIQPSAIAVEVSHVVRQDRPRVVVRYRAQTFPGNVVKAR